MLESTISIAFTINNNYAQHCCTAMLSTIINNPGTNFKFYIISDDLTDETKNKFIGTVNSHGNHNLVNFVKINSDLCNGLHININYITYHTYIRFYLSEIGRAHV